MRNAPSTLSTRGAAAGLCSVALVLAGCAGTDTSGPPPGPEPDADANAGVCEIVANGTPVVKVAEPDGQMVTLPADISTNPEVATGYRSDMTAVRTADYAAATANPLATQAACNVLHDGGSAADAVIAAQAVLGLVEPQSSGLGGGGFLLYYDAATGSVQAYDGREVAPAAADENYLRWVDDVSRSKPQPDIRASGRSIGVPGIMRMLADAHSDHGRVSWHELFDPAVALADGGFAISPRLATAITAAAEQLRADRAAAAYFLQPDGSPKSPGTMLTNPAYAKTLGVIASDGADGFYTGDIAEAVVAAAADTSGGRTPSLMTLEDLAGYSAKKREPLCTAYRAYEICGMPAPSSGGIAVASTMGILESFAMSEHRPTEVDLNGGRPTVMGVHLVSEAERLAYADRDKYVADTDFVPLPGGSADTLLNGQYLDDRATLISPERSMGKARPGDFGASQTPAVPAPEHGTSHISVVDSDGNAAALTTTIESSFGSFHMVEGFGFLLNNELTDFAKKPTDRDGNPVPNRVQPGKRPRSSITPTLVFERADSGSGRGALYATLGSPGGSMIIQFVVKTLVGMLDWGLDPQQAASMVDFGAANSSKTNVGGEHPLIDTADDGDHDPLIIGLRALGHQVNLADQSSGVAVVARDSQGWVGGADPRREGLVMGG